jgi:sugar porter (SP) family MFS transporter
MSYQELLMNNRYLWFVALVSALGGFLFGYDWVVIGGAKPFYEAYFGISRPSLEGWAMSSALVGCLVGALSSGILSERIGRRRALLVAAGVFAASAMGTGSAMNFTAFVWWRIAGGVAIGMASGLSPVYIAEIAPAENRGKLVCLNELTIVLGILAAQTVNWLIAKPVPPGASLADIQISWNGQEGWRRMFEVAAIPATVFLAGVYFIPESPRWLARQGSWELAKHILIRFGGERYASRTVDEMRASFHTETISSVGGALRNPRLLPVLGIGITLAVLQQWCGINVIFNYAQEVFSAAGYTLSNIFFNIVITGVVMCVFTFVAIATVERLGRRRLMLLGCAGLATLYTILGGLYFTNQRGLPLLALVVGAIACYAMTLAPITWVILSEIFPNDVRGTCMAICTTALWAACFILTYTFPLLNSSLGTARTFWIYAGICAAGFLFVLRYLPETTQKTLEEIQRSWQA